MRELLDSKLARFEQLERDLVDPEVLGDSTRLTAAAREHGTLSKLVGRYRAFLDTTQQIREAREMAKSGEIGDARAGRGRTRRAARPARGAVGRAARMTIGGEDANRNRCIMEIRAGTGGDEAALFARDLYEMYKRYAETKGWKMEILDASPTELGGFKEISPRH